MSLIRWCTTVHCVLLFTITMFCREISTVTLCALCDGVPTCLRTSHGYTGAQVMCLRGDCPPQSRQERLQVGASTSKLRLQVCQRCRKQIESILPCISIRTSANIQSTSWNASLLQVQRLQRVAAAKQDHIDHLNRKASLGFLREAQIQVSREIYTSVGRPSEVPVKTEKDKVMNTYFCR